MYMHQINAPKLQSTLPNGCEICTNAFKHSYHGQETYVRFRNQLKSTIKETKKSFCNIALNSKPTKL